MRLPHELAVAVVLLVIVGIPARSGVGRFVLPVVGLTVAAAFVALLAAQSAYPRIATSLRTRITESAAQSTNAACIGCESPATMYRCYTREWVVLGVLVILLDDGESPVCDAHRD